MSPNSAGLVGPVFERTPTSHPTPKVFGTSKSGFPAVHHRSKSAFARHREAQPKTGPLRLHNVPTVVQTGREHAPNPVDVSEWRNQMSRENEERVAGMTEEERDQEKQEILERFGAGVGDLLKRAKLVREKQGKRPLEAPMEPQTTEDLTTALDEVPIAARENFEKKIASQRHNLKNKYLVSSPSPALSTSSTRPSSRTDRRLRFAELAPEDVHVYESAPPSPRRKALALPPPPNDGSAISLGHFNGTMAAQPSPPHTETIVEPDEGSAEYIRRRYFPDAPGNDPNLAWMQPSSELSSSPVLPFSLRFDLSGKPIPQAISSTLPTHLGLHHHAEGTHAGYTLDDVFLLSRSTVPAQRATMLSVLAKIAKRISDLRHGIIEGMEELIGKEQDVRKRIVAAGVEAMMERGSVGARAVEVIWQCIVGCGEHITAIQGVEWGDSSDSIIDSLRLNFFLPQVATLFAQGEIMEETRAQLLDILHRLAQHSNVFAKSIVTTPKLIANIVQTFLLTPLPPTETSLPNVFALEFLVSLASASRTNANALQETADALLRFITFLPSSSMFPLPLATALPTSTLRFYTVLANYGLYAHIATTAQEQFTNLGRYILSDACTSPKLRVAWTDLLTAWTICAVDPHQTTPSHEILWSQIIGWGWSSEVIELSDQLGTEERDWPVWAGVWKVLVAHLGGARVNGIRGGSSDRIECLDAIKGGFEDGKEMQVVLGSLDALYRDLGTLSSVPIDSVQLPHLRALAGHAATLTASVRLWVACLPPSSGDPLDSPPFSLPFSRISDLCGTITVHPLWSLLASKDSTTWNAYVYLRPLSELLSAYLSLSRRLPGISKELWGAQALSILSNLLPGDEDFALHVVDDLLDLITPEWLSTLGIEVPPIFWDKGGMVVIKPFVVHTMRPHRDVCIGPSFLTPQSISKSTTLRVPSQTALNTYGLPVSRQWTLAPLDHLLRSGTSEVFKALPANWDASEVEIARASLLLTKVSREVLAHFSLTNSLLTRDEAVFGCMSIFMLEHGQTQTDSTEEVFRDGWISQLMEDLLGPYVVSATSTRLRPTPLPPSGDLEYVAAKYLGTTPFFQYYTDFVALYDAISFSHPLFSRLLLPPTSMQYALDYRKHLWNDFGHVLKTIRTPIGQVVCEDIKEYLWPVERDFQMLSFYLRALLQDSLQEFVRLIAVHHVASNIWQDLSSDLEWTEERAKQLLQVIVTQGGIDLIREVVQYRQSSTGSSSIPPHCFEALNDQVKTSRFECIAQWGLADRLRGLLFGT